MKCSWRKVDKMKDGWENKKRQREECKTGNRKDGAEKVDLKVERQKEIKGQWMRREREEGG